LAYFRQHYLAYLAALGGGNGWLATSMAGEYAAASFLSHNFRLAIYREKLSAI
jgi:hypothetical protein